MYPIDLPIIFMNIHKYPIFLVQNHPADPAQWHHPTFHRNLHQSRGVWVEWSEGPDL